MTRARSAQWCHQAICEPPRRHRNPKTRPSGPTPTAAYDRRQTLRGDLAGSSNKNRSGGVSETSCLWAGGFLDAAAASSVSNRRRSQSVGNSARLRIVLMRSWSSLLKKRHAPDRSPRNRGGRPVGTVAGPPLADWISSAALHCLFTGARPVQKEASAPETTVATHRPRPTVPPAHTPDGQPRVEWVIIIS